MYVANQCNVHQALSNKAFSLSLQQKFYLQGSTLREFKSIYIRGRYSYRLESVRIINDQDSDLTEALV